VIPEKTLGLKNENAKTRGKKKTKTISEVGGRVEKKKERLARRGRTKNYTNINKLKN